MFINLEPQPKEKYYVMFINLENQQKEQSSLMFINQSPKIHQTMSNLSNCLESYQYIDVNKCNHKNRHPRHNILQPCRGSKNLNPVLIQPTENLQSHPRKNFRINER